VSAGGTFLTAALLTGLVTATAAGPVLRALPEPADVPDKITYRSLVTPGFVVLCGGLAAAAAALSWHTTALAAQPLWTVLSTVGVLLAAIDARTTWLPLRLTQIAWLLMVVGALAAAVVLGGGWALLLRCGVGAGTAGALYFLGWVLTRGGFGFGDVRFAPLLGAATGADSWRLLLWALFLGTAVGGIHGLVRLARSGAGPFPYAPSMLAGAYLALAASWLYT
jgi:leader peptidase (prepilin peptidase) / N-methyltransferase